MAYSQSPRLVDKDLSIEDLLLDARARDLDTRSERRDDVRPKEAPIRSLHSSSRKDSQAARNRPSIGGRILRTSTRFFITVLIGVGATLAWQTYGDAAREMLAARAPRLAELLPISMTKYAVVATSSPDLTRQLAPLASNIDGVRRNLEQLAAKQDQMVHDIAALQAVDEDIRQKISSTPPVQQPVSIPQPKSAQPRMVSPAMQSAAAPRRLTTAAPTSR